MLTTKEFRARITVLNHLKELEHASNNFIKKLLIRMRIRQIAADETLISLYLND